MGLVMLCKERRACPSGKVAALFALVTIERSNKRQGRYPQRTYFCTRCRRWHLTSQPLA